MYIVKEESFSTETHCRHTSLINCYTQTLTAFIFRHNIVKEPNAQTILFKY